MKVYTIIDTWDDGGKQGCWVANYSDIGEARKCFFNHIHHYEPEMDDETIQFGFNDCLTGVGFTYDYDGGNEWGTLFVRQEEISDKFDPKQMPWAQ